MEHKSLKLLLTTMPRGMWPILMLQMLLVGTFAILVTGVHGVANNSLHDSTLQATELVSTFIVLQYSAHVVAGVIGGRLFSFRSLMVIALFLELAGLFGLCSYLHWAISLSVALISAGFGLSLACNNCLLTQLFKPEDKRRELAFYWLYAVMNFAYFFGLIANILSKKLSGAHTTSLLILCIFCVIFAGFILTLNWRKLGDRATYALGLSTLKTQKMKILGVVILVLTTLSIYTGLIHPVYNTVSILVCAVLLLCVLSILNSRQKLASVKKRLWVSLIFWLLGIIFWALYFLIPMGLFILLHVRAAQTLLGQTIGPNIYNIIPIAIIAIIGPVVGYGLYCLRQRKVNISIPLQFTIAFALLGICFSIIATANVLRGHSVLLPAAILVLIAVFQAFAEMFLQPAGLSMVGQLAPIGLQGILMGAWMIVTGIANSATSQVTPWLQHEHIVSLNPAMDNTILSTFGLSCFFIAIVLIVFTPTLHKFIQYRSLNPNLKS
jgi:POT family proton-dependent oligopeptide transporter